MQAVVMAAGEGTRLRPLTERWPKPVLPIDGRPVIVTLLRELAAAQLSPITVVTGHLAERLERLLDGLPFDLRLARQPEPVGSADAVATALAAGAQPPLLISAADTVYNAGDVVRFARAFEESDAIAAIAYRRAPPPGPGKAPIHVENGRVVRVVDDDRSIPIAAAPLWAFRPRFAGFLAELPGPPFELAEAAQRAIDSGELVAGVEIGPTRDLTYPVDLVEENFPYLSGT